MYLKLLDKGDLFLCFTPLLRFPIVLNGEFNTKDQKQFRHFSGVGETIKDKIKDIMLYTIISSFNSLHTLIISDNTKSKFTTICLLYNIRKRKMLKPKEEAYPSVTLSSHDIFPVSRTRRCWCWLPCHTEISSYIQINQNLY